MFFHKKVFKLCNKSVASLTFKWFLIPITCLNYCLGIKKILISSMAEQNTSNIQI